MHHRSGDAQLGEAVKLLQTPGLTGAKQGPPMLEEHGQLSPGPATPLTGARLKCGRLLGIDARVWDAFDQDPPLRPVLVVHPILTRCATGRTFGDRQLSTHESA